MSEIFLNTTEPSFANREKELKKEGYLEKKYTRTTADAIEEAFVRHMLKQIIPERGLSTPSEIDKLADELKIYTQENLYITSNNGNKVLKYKMYVMPIKPNNNTNIKLNYQNENFAPEDYAESLLEPERQKRAEKKAKKVALTQAVEELSPEIEALLSKYKMPSSSPLEKLNKNSLEYGIRRQQFYIDDAKKELEEAKQLFKVPGKRAEAKQKYNTAKATLSIAQTALNKYKRNYNELIKSTEPVNNINVSMGGKRRTLHKKGRKSSRKNMRRTRKN
jgi:hypothetical protein